MAQESFSRRKQGSDGHGSVGSCVIGKNIQIRGKLSGSEDLVVEGRIEGNVALKNHLTIEQTGVVEADVEVRDLTVNGEMRGDIAADGTVSITNSAKVVGNIRAPRIILEDGARFKGSIEMEVELPPGVKEGASGGGNAGSGKHKRERS
ncbi:MAG TPA: polymer-forming cytoskeletal protein [Polyangia bacterium]|nr:polymer-forming cytoskeletal protein [Polyangia bacterium]